MAKWKVLVGINYRPEGASDEVRAEPGDVIEDLPAKAAKWMEQQDIVAKPGSRAAKLYDDPTAEDEVEALVEGGEA